jgi:predicted nuclease of predicted toxin-antitoxin system
MRLLANENIPLDAIEALRKDGHDVLWIRAEAPGSTDLDVMALAQELDRVLITFGKDFGELAFRSKQPAICGMILFRVPMTSAAYIAQVLVKAIGSRSDWKGHFAVVERDRIRMKSLQKE